MSVKPLVVWGIAGAAALGLAIGFGVGLVTGRQDDEIKLNAEMLGAMQNLGGKIDKTFDDVANGVVEGDEQVYVKPDPPPPPFNIHIKSKLMVDTNTERGLRVSVLIDNKTGKPIRAFDGKMVITDLLDNPLIGAKIIINDPVATGASIQWSGLLDYSTYAATHDQVNRTDLDDLKIGFEPRRILYADGAIKDFPAR